MRKCILTVVVLMILLCGCGNTKAETAQVVMPEVGVFESMNSLSELPIPKNQNLLTGIGDLSKEAIGKRPIAVMINNVEEALPQYGISDADVIFELPVEGDLTRLMALYADYTQVPDICAIRSCRYYYPALAKGFDAFYIHWGCDQTVVSYVKSIQPDKFDGISNDGGLFGRDKSRRQSGYSLEHTGVFKGTKFASVVEKSGDRLELTDSKKGTAFQFCDVGTEVIPTGETCSTAKVKFGAASATLTYDAKTKTYKKDINGHAHKDGKTGKQLSFTNVFVLETSISIRDAKGHKKLDWAGSSSAKGYYISNGKMQEIRWSKANGSESSYLKFYDMTGKELVINRGKSYIAYTYKGKTTWE